MPRNAPGPAPHQIPGLLRLAVSDPLRSMYQTVSRYGDAVRIPFAPGRNIHLFCRPEHAEHILVARQQRYGKAFTYRPLREWIGLGLITSDGELWERQRRLIQPLFSHRRVSTLQPLMVDAIERMLREWDERPEGSVVDATEEMSGMTLDIVGATLFGADLTADRDRIYHAVETLQDAVTKVIKNPLTWVSAKAARRTSPGFRQWDQAKATIDEVVTRVIADRRSGRAESDGRDLLDALLNARHEDGTGIGDVQLRDEIVTFFMAGHETSANCLAWTLYLLSTSPAARERLEEEVDSVLAGRAPTQEDLDKLVWTRAVLSESMRLYPPVWTVERDAIAEDEVAGVPVSAGSTVIVPPYLVHRHPGVWSSPEAFAPERFLPERSGERHKYAFIPFGGGRRGCIGNAFALIEVVVALAMITQRYRLDLLPGFDPVPKVTVTLRPPQEMAMALRRRA
ncbi:cytochrome P450 [Streptomyces sp. AJS327]|uniref:cytochrome P450 n=1 Tax=Streptomyces sp. AJS327 TaxID=2545265 RepID=UPI0015DEFA8F|nr:cytochrome P450 [Streptomyces sp. AJS327]MBA0049534.1 cytochrome P450 [Streptomyces sp. AJS327]QTC09989.1 cytochrome P450 [Streptomyces sp.]